MRRPLALAVSLLALVAVPAASSRASVTHDPPRIVPWHMIGNIGVGMSQTRVSYSYGGGYSGGASGYDAVYRADSDGHILAVTYAAGKVFRVATDSPRYRTATGFGVGSRIPLGPCYPERGGACGHRWNGFIYNPPYHEWFKVTRQNGRDLQVQLTVSQGVVTDVALGVALY